MKLTNEDILYVLYTAKAQFIADRNTPNYGIGMCFYIQQSLKSIFNIYVYYSKIKSIIPEFVPKTFELNLENDLLWWWNAEDVDSRINAFDKLIEIYKNK